MRLFVAIELDAGARSAIDEERQRLVSAMGPSASDLRWVRRELLHLTLVFLGEVPLSRSPAIIEALGRDIARAPYQMTLAGLGIFPRRGAPRALWLGVTHGSGETIALQALMIERLGLSHNSTGTRARDVEKPPAAFTPHVTLARWRSGHASRRWATQDEHVLAVVPVDSVTLFESRLGPGGPSYTALARARLTCH